MNSVVNRRLTPGHHPFNNFLEYLEVIELCPIVASKKNTLLCVQTITKTLTNTKGSTSKCLGTLLKIHGNPFGHLTLQIDIAGIDPDEEDQILLLMLGPYCRCRTPLNSHDAFYVEMLKSAQENVSWILKMLANP